MKTYFTLSLLAHLALITVGIYLSFTELYVWTGAVAGVALYVILMYCPLLYAYTHETLKDWFVETLTKKPYGKEFATQLFIITGFTFLSCAFTNMLLLGITAFFTAWLVQTVIEWLTVKE